MSHTLTNAMRVLLSRHFRNPDDYKLAYLLDALRWPETAPRTDTPADFRSLTHRHS